MSETITQKPSTDIEPELQFSILCDRVVITPSGKPNFEEVFSLIIRPSRIRYFMVNRYINGVGAFRQKIRVYKPDTREFRDSPELTFKLEDRALAFDAVAQIETNFDRPGVWWIQILLNEKNILSYPLPILEGP